MPFYIQNKETELVLDLKIGEEGEETQVIMYPYNGGANQLWEFRDGMIHSKLNGWVLGNTHAHSTLRPGMLGILVSEHEVKEV
jgi:hypothetical protein